MIRPAAFATLVLLLAAVGCAGGSHRNTAPPVPPPQGPQATYVITYGVGQPQRSHAAVRARCPVGATCKVLRVSGVTPRTWQLAASRRLECDPAAGQYSNPARACRALTTVRRLLAHDHETCACALEIGLAAAAVGHDHGTPVWVHLDDCSLCGVPAGMQTRVLMPA